MRGRTHRPTFRHVAGQLQHEWVDGALAAPENQLVHPDNIDRGFELVAALRRIRPHFAMQPSRMARIEVCRTAGHGCGL